MGKAFLDWFQSFIAGFLNVPSWVKDVIIQISVQKLIILSVSAIVITALLTGQYNEKLMYPLMFVIGALVLWRE